MLTIAKIFIYFMEGFLMTGTGLGIMGIHIKFSKVALIATFYAFIVHGIRWFYISNHIPLGTHTPIILTFFCLLLILLGKQSVLDSIVATLVSGSILFFGEGVFLIPFLDFIHLDFYKILDRPLGLLLAAILSFIPLMIAFIATYTFKVTLINLKSFK